MASVLAVTEPCSTGIGGDALCMFYDHSTKEVISINGTGRTAAALSVSSLTEKFVGPHLPTSDGNSVTGVFI